MSAPSHSDIAELLNAQRKHACALADAEDTQLFDITPGMIASIDRMRVRMGLSPLAEDPAFQAIYAFAVKTLSSPPCPT